LHATLAPAQFSVPESKEINEGVLAVETKSTSEKIVVPEAENKLKEEKKEVKSTTAYTVPFYSQFADISAPEWRKVGCGIASLTMLIDYYQPHEVTVNELLQRGIDAGAYSDAGWSHTGLITLSHKYGLKGESHDLSAKSMEDAFASLKTELKDGPVMASVHYTFTPTNPIPHIVVISGVSDGKVYYNDPAEKSGGGSISIAKFQGAWKKRYIEIRPA
jgi:predicted double-glycine peptidase